MSNGGSGFGDFLQSDKGTAVAGIASGLIDTLAPQDKVNQQFLARNQDIAGNSQLLAYADQMVIMTHVMSWLPFIIGVVGILLMIVMYKTWRADIYA